MDTLQLLLRRMTDLYLRFTIPHIVVNTKTGELTCWDTWVSPEIEKLYNYLGETLSKEIQKIREKEAERYWQEDYEDWAAEIRSKPELLEAYKKYRAAVDSLDLPASPP